MKIYTKTGDSGQTSLLSSQRFNKDDSIFDVLGTIDEFVAYLNTIIYTNQTNENIHQKTTDLSLLTDFSLFLLTFAAHLSSYETSKDEEFIENYTKNYTEYLETTIDSIEKTLPPLKNFILPGNTLISSMIHYSRTICRRLERYCVTLLESNHFVEYWLKPINRLSDTLFVVARYHSSNVPEKILKFENKQYTLIDLK